MLTDMLSKMRKSWRETCNRVYALKWFFDPSKGPAPVPGDGRQLPEHPGNITEGRDKGQLSKY
jgi:hypothetical protein